jgi:outer membrane protein assembly factor BamA
MNVNTAVWQVPIYRYLGGGYLPLMVAGRERLVAANVFLRDVIRGGELGLSYPFNTYRRLELNTLGVHYQSKVLYRGVDLETYEPVEVDQDNGGFSYVQPQAALVFDNTLFGWTGPIVGRRYRLQISRTLGGLGFTEGLIDFRNYVNFRQKIVLATRLTGLSRSGSDSERFALFWGGPYFIRGYDYNSFRPGGRECTESGSGPGESLSRCPTRDQLVGSSAAFLNAEVRFPLLTELQIGFLGNFPPVDAVAFFDGGVAWDERVCGSYDYRRADRCAPGYSHPVRVTWSRTADEDPFLVREPLFSYGLGMRINIFYTVIRIDYAWPISRPQRNGILSFSFGPSF